jgi:pyruvate dehydrogenase E1 component alpha subunit
MKVKKDTVTDILLNLYRNMVRIRLFEEEAIELAKAGKTRAVVHTYVGQEAIAVGACSHLTNEDYITSTHRGHGHCIAKGADLRKMFAELMGRETGYCKGKGGSMHIADLDTGNLGANGIVGGGIPIGTGAAVGLAVAKKQHVVVCFFGDGASNQGSFHESLNLASIWNLPVVYICENNKYGISTHYSQAVNIEHISDRAKAYGIPGYTIDGNDVIKVREEVGKAIERCLAGEGPTLIEADTYRISGHYFGDNENYRSRDEVNEWRQKDPIQRFETYLIQQQGITKAMLETILEEERVSVLAASKKAEEDPEPKVEDMVKDIYASEFAQIVWKPFVKN